MKKKIFLVLLAIVLIAASVSFWRSMCSTTQIGFVNYQAITLGEISKANDNSFISIKNQTLDDIDEWDDCDAILINAMGIRMTEEQREKIQALADKGLPILTTAATNPANLIVSMDEWDVDTLKQYLSEGGRQNYRSMLNYLRNDVNGKLFFNNKVEEVKIQDTQLLYHPNVKDLDEEDCSFSDVKSYQAYLAKNGLFKDKSAKNILIIGLMGNAKDLILKLEETGNVVYAARDLKTLIRYHHIDSIKPNAIINMAHGRVGDFMVDYLKDKNIPVFSTINVNRMTEEWEKDKQGMSGGFLSQSVIVPEIDGIIRPFVLFAIREGEDGLPEAYTIPERLETFVTAVNKHLALQTMSNKDKKVAIVYFKGAGSNSLTASGLEVVPSLYNMLIKMKNEGYKIDNMPASPEALASLIQKSGSIFGTYAEGAMLNFMENGNPVLVNKADFEKWTKSSLTSTAFAQMKKTNGDFPGKYFAKDIEHLGLPIIRLGNVVLMPQMPAGSGNDSFKMVHGTDDVPPYPYLAEYLWIQNAFKADALIHFGTHGSLEYTPGKQVALDQNSWSDRLIGSTPHFYLYTIGNVGEGLIAKRRSYATLVSYLTPPFMESNLRSTYKELSDAVENYNKLMGKENTDKKVLDAEGKKVKALTVKLGIHRELHLDSTLNVPFSADEVAKVEAFAEELCNEKINGKSYVLGVPYEDERINTSVYAMATDPIAYSLLALDKLQKKASADTEKHKSLFTARYLMPAKALVGKLLARNTEVTDAEICAIAHISLDDLKKAHHIDSVIVAPQNMMSMMMSMANEVPGAKSKVMTKGHAAHPGNMGKSGHPGKDSGKTTEDNSKKSDDKSKAGPSDADKAKMRKMAEGMDPKKALAIAKMMGASPEQLKKMKEGMMKAKKGQGSGMGDAHTESKMSNMPPAMKAIIDKVAEKAMLKKEDVDFCHAVLEVERTIRNVNAYRRYLLESPQLEMASMMNALNGGYVAPSPGGDVISNPNTLPTGRNLFGVNTEACPSEQAWEKGKALAENTIKMYRERHNDSIPRKVSYTLWSSEFIETEGATIAQCLYMLGVEPIRDAFGRVTDIRLIPSKELGRPRIDVVVQTSGQLRDLAASRLFLLSRAVKMAAEAKDDKFDNMVADGVKEAEKILVEKGVSPKNAREMSTYRVFGGLNGNYGTGIQGMTMAGDKWEKESELADTYINNMGAYYGSEDNWEEATQFAFEAALSRTDAVIQPRQSNTWGALSLDHVYEFMGGMNMAVRNVTGKDPDAYLSDYRNRNNAKMQEVKEAIGVESRTTLFNPTYIKEKMQGGASDANTFAELIQNTYGWNVMKPEAIDNEMWNEIYDTYVQDKHELGTRQFFETKNPAALQEMTAVMMETARKGYWKASDSQLRNIAKLHTELVNKYGASGSEMVNDNQKLQDFIADKVDKSEAKDYRQKIAEVRDEQVNTADGKVLKKEELNAEQSSTKAIINNVVIAVVVLLAIIGIIILVRRRRNAMKQEE